MKLNIFRVSTYVLALSMVAVVLGSAACAPSVSPAQAQELQQKVDKLEQQVRKNAEMQDLVQKVISEAAVTASLVAINNIDSAGLHGMDETINKEEKIDTRYLDTVKRIRSINRATPWAEALKKDSDGLERSLADLEKALSSNDLASAKGAAHEVHERAHDFSKNVYKWVGESRGVSN